MTNTWKRLPSKAAGIPIRRIWPWMMVVLLTGISIARADYPITITGTNNLAFGIMFRNSSASVSYGSANAARFTVTGRKSQSVTLIVSMTAMITGNGAVTGLVRRLMSPTLTMQSCQYSLDNGATWRAFTSSNGATATVTTTFPRGSGTNSSILVRVGATLTSALTQQRGNYLGLISLNAEYDDGNNGHGNDDDHDDDSNPGHGWGW